MTNINWGILDASFTRYKDLKDILKALIKNRATPYLAGGCVRDMVLGHEIKDLDIEVHGLSLDVLEEVLGSFGHVRLAGKQFGVLRIDGLDIDWSIPRTDSAGRRPKVEFDSSMTIEQAARRRDVTMNAMAINLAQVLEGRRVIIDPFNGLDAIEKKQLRCIDEKLFVEDPLRFYRVMQFIGRFEMEPDACLNRICKAIDISKVSRERVWDELCKLFLKSRRPSLGLRWLLKLGRIEEIMPQIAACIGVIQPPEHHPEGDVFEHTMQALDAAALLKFSSTREKLIVVVGALCHDLGKPLVTDAQGHAYGHDKVGVDSAKLFLKRFTDDAALIAAVSKLVRYHLAPRDFVEQDSGLKAYKRLALKLAPHATMRQLALVACSDALAKNPAGGEPLAVQPGFVALFLETAQKAHVEHRPEEPVLKGRDVLDVVLPGPQMGALLRKAYEIQIEEGITDPAILKRRVLDK